MCLRKPVFAGVFALAVAALALNACSQLTQTENAICARIAAMPPSAVAILDAQDPHGVIGNLWAYQKSACVNGLPAAGVSTSFGAMIWGELKVLIPQLLPMLVPVLIGLL